MSPLDDIPEPWRSAMENAGLYSARDLAAKTGIGPTTASDLLHGRKLSTERTMQAVADSLRLPVTTVRGWAATSRGEAGPFELPPEANRLTKRQRDAVVGLVRAMLDPGPQDEVGPPDMSDPDIQGIRLDETSPNLRVVEQRNGPEGT